MSELERRLRAASRSNAAAATNAHAPSEVRRSIGRRRALMPGALSVMGAVIIGSLAVGGLGLTEPTAPAAPTPTPDLSIARGPQDYATVALPAGPMADDYLYDSLQQWCGQPPPSPTNAGDDFTAVFDVPETLDLDRQNASGGDMVVTGHAQLTYTGEEPLPVSTGVMTALLVQDGTVVGVSNSNQPVMQTFEPQQTRIATWRWHSWMGGCGESPFAEPPPAGDYEVVFVAHVHNDQATAVRWSLQTKGYGLPFADAAGDFEEGSYRCSQWEQWGMYRPVTCAPAAFVGFELDEAAGTATVPYSTEFYVRDVDVTMASQPIPATLSAAEAPMGKPESLPSLDPGTEPTCGTVYGELGDYGALSSTLPTLQNAPTAGDTIATTLWSDSMGWKQGTVAVPTDPRMWVARTTTAHVPLADGVTSYGWVGYEIIGWVDTESPSPPGPIHLSNYDGPSDWVLTVTDVQWCEEDDGEPMSPIKPSDHAVGVITAQTDLVLDGNLTVPSDVIVFTPSQGF